jgi:metallo-beta-lactamase class B
MFIALGLHSQGLEIHPLTGDVYLYTTYQDYEGNPVPANGLYFVTDAGALLIDTPWDTTQCLSLLDSIMTRHHQPVRWSISTHSHADRTGSIDILKRQGVATFSSIQTQEICRERGECVAAFGFARDTVFQLGSVRVETYYPGPGHAPDNIVVWLPATGVLHGGCFVKSIESTGLGNVADADIARWPAAIQAVQAKFPKPKWIIPGHGSWQSKHALKHTRKLLRAGS